MKSDIRIAADAIRENNGADAVKKACLYIIERGMLYACDATQVAQNPESPALWAAQLCDAAHEDSEVLMCAIAELLGEMACLYGA